MIYETMRVPAKPRGGALPTYQRQGKIHAPGAGVNARMDDSAARIAGTGADAEARALAGLGKAIQGAADVGLKAYDDYQTVKATEGYNAFQQAMNDKLYGENGIFTRQGEAAFGSAEDMERAISETREDVARQLGLSDVARQKLGKQVFAYGLQFVPKAQKHAADERKKWADGQDQASLELNLEGFLNNPNDTQARLMYLSTMQQSYRQYADRNGLGAEQRELGWKKILSAAYSQLADKYITAGDLNAARKLVADEPLWMEGDQDKIRAKIQARAEALQAEAEKRRKQAEEAAEKRAVQGTVDAVLSGAAGFPTLEEQREAAFRMVDQIEQPEIKDKLRTEISKEFAWREKARDATTAREVRQYQELARAQNWTPRQAADILSRATDISGTAREKLEKDYNGRAERATPENKAALAELRAMLDKGAERGGIDPKDTDAIDAYIYSHGLTYEQGVNAHRYAEQGGIAGEVTQTQINRAYKTLFPNRKEKSAPGDLLDLVGEELKRTAAGKSATDAEVRRVMSRLFAEGETEDAGWFAWGIGKDETYMDALRKGRGDAWSADVEVPAEDAARIEELLREEGVTPTPGRVRRYYWEEQEGKA